MRIFALFISLLCFTLVSAQTNTGLFYGNVKDAQSKQAIYSATVALYQEDKLIMGGSTDFDGSFNIKDIPVGRYTATISFIGYESKTIDDVLIQTGIDYNATVFFKRIAK